MKRKVSWCRPTCRSVTGRPSSPTPGVRSRSSTASSTTPRSSRLKATASDAASPRPSGSSRDRDRTADSAAGPNSRASSCRATADIFRRYGEAYRQAHEGSLSAAHRRVMRAIETGRTAALGGHVERGDHGQHTRIWYNSCANRHGPSCQALARADWIEDRQAELLDTPYFHVVFTVPDAIAAIAAQNKARVYGILFRTAAETLRTIAADPQHLGAEIGFFAVLHTWGQNLLHHPHVHCVVPGGGISADGSRWVACKSRYFLPVRVLSRVFRGKFLALLRGAFKQGKLAFRGRLSPLADASEFHRVLAASARVRWVVYAKPPT